MDLSRNFLMDSHTFFKLGDKVAHGVPYTENSNVSHSEGLFYYIWRN